MTKPSSQKQVSRLMNKLNLTSWTKTDQKRAGAIGYRSQVTFLKRTADAQRAVERIFQREDISRIKDITPHMMTREIERLKAQNLNSSTIAGYAKVLSDIHRYLHGHEVNYSGLVPSRSFDYPTKGRAYTSEQVTEIIQIQSIECGLMTEVAYASGSRSSELNGLRPSNEFPIHITTVRLNQLADYRWDGRTGVKYIVTGKGGLEREIMIPNELAQRLEAFRLKEPRHIQATRGEDGREFVQHYDLPTGEQWSRDFTNKSMELFNWSNGAHGLRHSFAQERVLELGNLGYSFEMARYSVSNLLGHFRSSETDKYLR